MWPIRRRRGEVPTQHAGHLLMTDARLAREMQLTRGVHSVLLTDEEMVRWYVRPRSVFHSGCVHTHVYIVCVHAPCAPARGTSAGRL